MKNKSLIAYLVIVTLFSADFIVLIKLAGENGNYLAAPYMLGPAVAGIIVRIFFHKNKFKDANLKFGKVKNYFLFWLVALFVGILPFLFYTLFGSIQWDFSGQVFLDQLAKQFALSGQDINNLPEGFTPQMMLLIYFVGGLTIFNIFPGIITGFGEEFGWRGLMFPELYKIKPWVAFIVGGLIWYAWHLPLVLVMGQQQDLTTTQMIINVIVLAVGSICTHTFLAYVYVKSKNIWVTSIAHITLDNTARAFAYYVILLNQFRANIGLTIAMLIVVAILFFSKEWKVFDSITGKSIIS